MADMNDNQKSKQQKEQARTVNNLKRNAGRILLAEDDYEMRALLGESLRMAGYEVVICSNGWGLLEELGGYVLPGPQHKHVDLVISDIRMPGITGFEILEGLQDLENCPPIILITAFGDREAHERAVQYGAAAMFDKPFDMDELLDKVRNIDPRVNVK